MGNSTSTPSRLPVGGSNLVSEIGPDVQYEKSMGNSRFLKAIKARHRQGQIVVKAYLKPDPSMSLRTLVRRMRVEREALADVPNVLTYQKVVETAAAGYLIRQWLASNLYDRISTRPFLIPIEKKWITYQLLFAMQEARRRKIPHGDLKSENVLVTSTLSVYITDFAASFKPAFLPLNDPSDFNFFFGTSGRRTCYVAPERFYSEDSEIAKQKAAARAEATGVSAGAGSNGSNVPSLPPGDPAAEILGLGSKRDGRVTEAMDVFALGCVLAELWRDGAPIFTLTQLFKYREGAFDIEPSLGEISDVGIRDLVRSMISLEPKDRPTFEQSLKSVQGTALPDAFYSFLHPYLTSLQRLAPEKIARLASGTNGSLSSNAGGNTASAAVAAAAASSESGAASASRPLAFAELRAEADERIERLGEDWAEVIQHFGEGRDGTVTPRPQSPEMPFSAPIDKISDDEKRSAPTRGVFPVQLSIPGMAPEDLLPAAKPADEDGPAILILTVILANMRSAARPSNKVLALDLLLHLSMRWLTDETKLDRVLPYMMALLDDPSAAVRTATLRSITQLLLLVDMLTPSNALVMQEYILPNLRRVTVDPSPNVRAMYAQCLVELCRTGQRFLQITQAMRAAGVFAVDGEEDGEGDDFGQPAALEGSGYDGQMSMLRQALQEQVSALLTDPSPTVKRALLADTEPLCRFLGPGPTNDVLLSHMITYLNDRSWQLRHAFFDAIVGVARVVGPVSVHEYILPLMLQALSDQEEFVVAQVLRSLAKLVDPGGLLTDGDVLDVIGAVAGFLCHPNFWLRTASAGLIELCCRGMAAPKVWAIAYPSLRPLLRADVPVLDELTLLASAKSPLSRPVLQAALTWAARVNKSNFWKPQRDDRGKAGLANGLGREGIGLMAGRSGRALPKTPIPRSEEDDGYLDKLRALGMTAEDEIKLVALRDYIWKLAKQSSSVRGTPASQDSNDESGMPSLQIKSSFETQPLEGVTPLTIFFTDKAAASSAAAVAPPSDAMSQGLGSYRSVTNTSLPAQIARRRMIGGSRTPSMSSVASPLEELRRRMNATTSTYAGGLALPETPGAVDVGSSPVPSSPTSATATARLGKAAPAVASSSTVATGQMTDLAARLRGMNTGTASSGQATPTKQRGNAEPDDAADAEPLFTSTYEGSDPYIQAHLEAVFLKSYRGRNPRWGPVVPSAASNPPRRRAMRNASGTARPLASASSNRRPEGNLVAYFTEHTAAITAIVVSPDHAFFVSASEDGTLKAWDTARLEKNVTSRSRGTYTGQRGAITSLIALEGSHCVASAAVDGSIHVLRIDVNVASSLPKYGKMRLVSNFQLSSPGEYATSLWQSSATPGVTTAAAASESGSTTTLIVGTNRSRLIVLDLRTMQVLQTLRNPAHMGAITCLCTDKRNIWLLAGTMRGVMALWDLRFGLLLKSWRVGAGEGGSDSVRVTRCVLHPSKGKGRWVMVAYERFDGGGASPSSPLVETWDIDRGVLVETFEAVPSGSRDAAARKTKDVPSEARQAARSAKERTEGLESAAAAIERLVRQTEAQAAALAEGEDDEEEGEVAKVEATQTSHGLPSAPPPALGMGVHALLVSLEGYSSSSAAAPSGQVSGGWLDAGKLAAEAEGREGAASSASSSAAATYTGPAGFMLTGGEDRRIRFWDLGRAEKGTCVGTVDERSEFRTVPPSEPGRPLTHTHVLHSTNSASSFARTSIRSPLLAQTQGSTSQALIKAHKDAITALGLLELPFRCIVAGDRSGAIKVWE